MKQLSEQQLRTLIETPDADLKKAFPGYPRDFLRREKVRAADVLSPQVRLEVDAAAIRERAKTREALRLYDAAQHELARLRDELRLAHSLPEVEPRDMRIEGKAGEREATAVVLASDWHAEERVRPEQVNGLNDFDLEEFDRRAKWFFRNTLKLIDKEAQAIEVRNLVAGFLGDLISNCIHEDLAETNQLGPMQAVALVQDTIAGGIREWLRATPKTMRLTVVWKLGNHPRTTARVRVHTEANHSLEWLMAHSLAREFAKEPRVRFVREQALLTYLDVHDTTIRFLHGHAVNYYGGVGGITIPINKAIAQWDKGRRAHVTCLGHFHQLTFGAGFICNGSLIGYSPYAVQIKASPEPPAQAFFLVDSRHGVTVRAPVLLEDA
jgi:hypothetical protein